MSQVSESGGERDESIKMEGIFVEKIGNLIGYGSVIGNA